MVTQISDRSPTFIWFMVFLYFLIRVNSLFLNLLSDLQTRSSKWLNPTYLTSHVAHGSDHQSVRLFHTSHTVSHHQIHFLKFLGDQDSRCLGGTSKTSGMFQDPPSPDQLFVILNMLYNLVNDFFTSFVFLNKLYNLVNDSVDIITRGTSSPDFSSRESNLSSPLSVFPRFVWQNYISQRILWVCVAGVPGTRCAKIK